MENRQTIPTIHVIDDDPVLLDTLNMLLSWKVMRSKRMRPLELFLKRVADAKAVAS